MKNMLTGSDREPEVKKIKLAGFSLLFCLAFLFASAVITRLSGFLPAGVPAAAKAFLAGVLQTALFFSFLYLWAARLASKGREARKDTLGEDIEWEKTFNALTDLVFIQDKDFNIIRANKAFAGAIGKPLEDIIGKKCYKIVHNMDSPWPECPFCLAKQDGEGHAVAVDDPNIGIPLLVSVSPILDDKGEVAGSVHIAKDITERVKAENFQRFAQLGGIAADVAHEINNPLQIISGSAQLMLMTLKGEDKESEESLGVIIGQCKRAKRIVERMMLIANPGTEENEKISIEENLRAVIDLLEHGLSIKKVNVEIGLLPVQHMIKASAGRMREVFISLINNAAEAMPGGGVINISVRAENGNVHVEFKDTGRGMAPDIMKKIFDPFFSTKQMGPGLGLSVSYSIIKGYGGDLRYRSKPGEGTTATLILPLCGE
ncbi:MAG: ATP-binding protein [Candidatus Omnitrophota bacterium]